MLKAKAKRDFKNNPVILFCKLSKLSFKAEVTQWGILNYLSQSKVLSLYPPPSQWIEQSCVTSSLSFCQHQHHEGPLASDRSCGQMSLGRHPGGLLCTAPSCGLRHTALGQAVLFSPAFSKLARVPQRIRGQSELLECTGREVLLEDEVFEQSSN